ncbi:ESX secretion-associated protein EspG [Kibdelosporangium aridum]|uniref:ESX secretion-associated protein EspG n=1 Tax=Kibdelosporangium aridum TaxID=2030 RepID=UPI00052725FA
MAFTARLPAEAVRVLCDRLEVRLPAAIVLPPTGFEADVTTQLRRNGWIDARGDVEGRLAAALRVLDRPDHLVEAIRHVGSKTHAVLAVAGRRAVKVLLSGDRMQVRRIQPGGLADQAAMLLPNLSAGQGRSVSVPTAVLQAAAKEAGNDIAALRSALQSHGISPAIAYLIAKMNEDVVSTAQFSVAVATKDRRMRRGDHVIGWWATNTGGYLAEEHKSSSGESWTTIAPSDTARLARQIDRQLDLLIRSR